VLSDLEVDLAAPVEEWDERVARAQGGHYRQTSGWAHVKAAAGWDAVRLLLRRRGTPVAACQLLVKRLPLGRKVAYVPRGPLLANRDPQLCDAMLSAVGQVARDERIVYLKLQPPVDRDDMPALLQRRGMVASQVHTAPAASVRVDVGPERDVDGLFKAMRSTTRRRVRQAEKHGIVVRDGDAADLPSLQELLEATGRRQGFRPYPAEYHRRLWEAFASRGQARLLISEHEGVPLSMAFLVAFGDTVIYKIGAWGGRKGSPPGPNELMHWTAIRWAHDAGFKYYDFDGIPVDVARHVVEGGPPPTDGLSFFKLGFGGMAVIYPGTYDQVLGRVAGPTLGRFIPRAERFQRRLAARR
jgi:lipid II:glycine glycyltransferase (peptidoglycan interpeptide bridge formation enzyme)